MADRDTEGRRGATDDLSIQTAIESMPDPVVLVEAASREVTTSNEAAGGLFDCQREALVGFGLADFVPSAHQSRFTNAFERALSGECVARYPGGGPIHVETSAGERSPVELAVERVEGTGLLLVQFRGTRERIDRERRLREMTARLETLVTAAPVPVVILDTDWTVERWNHAAEETFGWPAAEVLGERYPLFPPDDAAQLDELFGKLLDGSILRGIERTHQARDGSLLEVELYAQPLQHDGSIDCVILSAIDVTEVKQREQHLSVLHRVLRHNLRNKLNVIHASAQQLAANTADNGHVTRLQNATEELISLGERAQQIERELQATKEEPIPATLDSILSELSTQLETDYPDAVLSITDESGFEEVFVPALTRTILVALVDKAVSRSERSTPTVEIEADVDRRLRLTITDDGPGITSGERSLIEEGKETELLHGSGLDLARVHILVTELGGQISISNYDSRGTTVQVELPRVVDDAILPR